MYKYILQWLKSTLNASYWFNLSDTIDIQEVRDHPNRIWNKEGLSRNKGITIYDIDNLRLPNSIGDWNWSELSQYIDIQEVRDHQDRPWNRIYLNMNPGITEDDVDNLYLPNAIGYW